MSYCLIKKTNYLIIRQLGYLKDPWLSVPVPATDLALTQLTIIIYI